MFKMRSRRQRDPISVNLFVLALETVFIMFKCNQNIQVKRITYHGFLYTAYTDETTFFIKSKDPVIELLTLIRFGWVT